MPASISLQYQSPDDYESANATRKRSDRTAVQTIQEGVIDILQRAGIREDAYVIDAANNGQVNILCSGEELHHVEAQVRQAAKFMVPQGHIVGTTSIHRFESGAGI